MKAIQELNDEIKILKMVMQYKTKQNKYLHISDLNEISIESKSIFKDWSTHCDTVCFRGLDELNFIRRFDQ